MIRAIIIDDEEHAINTILRKTKTYCPDIKVVDTATSADEAFNKIKDLKPDLIFLDVAMPNESGFDFLNKFEKIDFEVIFVTGFDSYAISAIEFCAIGYLLKPIDNEDMIKAVHRAKARINIKSQGSKIDQLLNNLSHPGDLNNKIGIPTMEGLEFVTVKEIIRCEGLQKFTRIIIKNQKDIFSSYNIGEFIKLLERYNFFTTHKSHLINLNYIKKYNKEGTIVMEDDSQIPVAKRRKKAFLDSMTRL